MSSFIPIKIVKVSSNDTVPLIYLPKEVRERLDLEKGDKVIMCINVDGSRLLIQKVPHIGDNGTARAYAESNQAKEGKR